MIGGETWTLLARNVSTLAEPVTIATGFYNYGSSHEVTPAPFYNWVVAGNRVAWIDADKRLLVREIGGDAPSVVAEGIEYPYAVQLSGDWLTYVLPHTAVNQNLTTGERQEATLDTREQLTSDGHDAFWIGADSDSAPYRLLGYDFQAGARFPVAIEPFGPNTVAHVAHGTLVWLVDKEIHALSTNELHTGTAWTYFPETQHYVAFGFREYWERNGGLPVFGYPLTEAGAGLNETSPVNNSSTIQYFERQRFEWHAEFAGTPYNIELGLLGTDAARVNGLLTSPPFKRLPDDTTGDANCTFFLETGHRVCAGFLAYWESHGLELGDSNITQREALALFGYPISEEFTDPETGLTIQYFERAVFEYHPENAGTPYEVLLRRLGAEVLAARGW